MHGAAFYPWSYFSSQKSTTISYFTNYKSCPKIVGTMRRKMEVKGRWSGVGVGGQKFVCLAQQKKQSQCCSYIYATDLNIRCLTAVVMEIRLQRSVE
jgi:hypothetical protein